MKNKKMIIAISSFLFFLSGCNIQTEEEVREQELNEVTEEVEQESTVINRNQLGKNYYRPALDDEGRYQPSKNRGITLSLNSGINLNLFEKDLISLSQNLFPTDSYFIQEGQYLPEDLVTSWLARETENNPDGLNPPESGEGDDRVPRYLNSILELNFLEETEGQEPTLGGISIGLALNTVDYYPAYQFGPTLEQEIPEAEMLEQGKAMGNEITRRIRDIEGLEDVTIMVGLYKQSARDNLAGGVYLAEGISEDGSTVIQSWDTINEKRVIYPLEGTASAEGNAFANFQSEVEAFFPNISGITGRAHYMNDQLDSFNINIMTQFYGETEMISYTQFLKQSAATYLPGDIDVEIVVESPGGVEAFLEKGRTEVEYYSHVFD